ncbi:MAG TPA: peptidoglycan-binding domain-containing protein [Gemmatimonadales bacterium]|nr:peptidoglycan-binding domain-containing protein [Gemmatimonadales bacterium]
MFRSLALASTVLAASLTASALSAQTAAPAKPTAPTASPAPTAHAKMDSATTSMSKSTTATKHAVWTSDQVKEAQAGLAKAGYYKGKPTGQFNADTKKALKAYQKANKLPVTGRLSDDVLSRLKSA